MINEKQVETLLENYEVLTEEQLMFLVENRVQFIKNAVKDKLDVSHDPNASKMDSDNIVDHIATKIDPTPNKEYTQWLVNRYKNKEFSVADHKDVKKSVSAFHDARPYTPVTDVGSVKSIAEMKDHTTIAKGLIAQKKAVAEEEVKPLKEVFRSGEIYGVKIPNAKVSTKLYGPNGKVAQTRWCTASEGANAFNSYPGGKYVLHLPTGDVAQVNHQKSQFMDKHDHTVDLKKSPFKEHVDVVKDFLHQTAQQEGVESELLTRYNIKSKTPAPEGSLKSLIDENNAHAASYTPNSEWSVRNKHQTGLTTTLEEAYKIAAKQPLSDVDFNAALTSTMYEDKWEKRETHLRAMLAENPNLKLHQVHALADTEYAPHPEAEHDKESLHKVINNIKSYLFSRYSSYGRDYVSHPSLHPDHVSQIYRLAKDNNDKSYALSRLHEDVEVPKHVIDDALSNPDVIGSLGHTKAIADPEVAQKVFDRTENDAARYLVNNKHLAVPVLMHNINKTKHLSYQQFLDREDVTPEHAETLVKHHLDTPGQNGSLVELMGHPKVSRAVFEAALKSSPSTFANNSSVLNTRRIKSSDIDFLLDNGHATSTTVYGALKSRALKPSHIDKFIDQGHAAKVTEHIIENPETEQVTHSHINRLYNSDDTIFHSKAQLLAHPKVSLPVFQQAMQNKRMHGAIASSPYAPPSILHSLATTGMDHVRELVAKHKNTSNDTLKVLANDENNEVAVAAMKRVKK